MNNMKNCIKLHYLTIKNIQKNNKIKLTKLIFTRENNKQMINLKSMKNNLQSYYSSQNTSVHIDEQALRAFRLAHFELFWFLRLCCFGGHLNCSKFIFLKFTWRKRVGNGWMREKWEITSFWPFGSVFREISNLRVVWWCFVDSWMVEVVEVELGVVVCWGTCYLLLLIVNVWYFLLIYRFFVIFYYSCALNLIENKKKSLKFTCDDNYQKWKKQLFYFFFPFSFSNAHLLLVHLREKP